MEKTTLKLNDKTDIQIEIDSYGILLSVVNIEGKIENQKYLNVQELESIILTEKIF